MFNFIERAFALQKVFITLLIGVVIAGVYSYLQLYRYDYTEFQENIFNIVIQHAGFSSEYIDKQIVQDVEASVKNLSDINFHGFTITDLGHSVGVVGFNQNKNFTEAKQELSNIMDLVTKEHDLDYKISDSSNSKIKISVLFGQSTLLHDEFMYKLKEIRDLVKDLPSVDKARLSGLPDKKILISVNPLALEQYSVNTNNIISVLKSQKLILPKLELYQGDLGYLELPIVANTLRDVYDLKTLKILTKTPHNINSNSMINNVIPNVTLDDVANIRMMSKPRFYNVFLNKDRAYLLQVFVMKNTNVVDLSHALKKLIKNYTENIDINYRFVQDLGPAVEDQITNLMNTILTAIILNAILIVLFIGLRFGFSVVLSIPITFLMLYIIMFLSGMSINFMSLFACILSTGLIVDNSIIISDMVQVNLRKGMNLTQAYIRALRTMLTPIISANLTTICVFLPMWLMSSSIMSHRLMDLVIPVTIALFLSMMISLFVMPLLTIILFSKIDKTFVRVHIVMHRLEKWYQSLLNLMLIHPRGIWCSCFCLVVFAAGSLLWIVTSDLVFTSDIKSSTDSLNVEYNSSKNITQKDNKNLMMTTIDQFNNLPDVEYVISRYEDLSNVSYQLILKDKKLREIDNDAQYMSMLFDILPEESDDMSWLFQSHSITGGSDSNQSRNVLLLQILADNTAQLNDVTSVFKKKLSNMSDMVYHKRITLNMITSSKDITADYQVLKLYLDRNRLNDHLQGIPLSSIIQKLLMFTKQGLKVDEFDFENHAERIPIYIKIDNKYQDLSGLMNMNITNSAGVQKPLSDFFQLKFDNNLSRVMRQNGTYFKVLAIPLKSNIYRSQVLQTLNTVVNSDNDRFLGVKMQEFDTNRENALFIQFWINTLTVSMFLIVLILFLQYGSFWQITIGVVNLTLCVLSTLLILSLTSGIFSFQMSGMGISCLIGIVTNNNIVLIHAYNILREKNTPAIKAIISASVTRLRPIMLTTLTTVLAIIPIVFGVQILWTDLDIEFNSISSVIWFDFSLAFSVGMLSGMVLTLTTIPLLLALGEKIHCQIKKLFVPKRSQLIQHTSI